MIKSRFLLFLAALLASMGAPLVARAQNPVTWSAQIQPSGIRAGEGGRVVLTAKIEAPWYIYAPSTPPGGPNPTKIALVASKTVTQSGKISQPAPTKHFDEGFQMNTETFAKGVSFGVPIQIKKGATGAQKIVVSVRYQTCNAKLCLPPKTVEVPVTFTPAAGAARANLLKPDTSVPPQATAQQISNPDAPKPPVATGAATIQSTSTQPDAQPNPAANGLVAYLGIALGAGFLALLTPCVFPMIPITVSFFTKRSEGKQQGIAGPLAFCAGIISTFTIVGVAASIAFGAAGIARFAANPYVNLALAALFILLALNLFGVFEIVVPSGVLNRVQTKKGGLLAPLLMGFAFTLTSFTCTVPFVGTALFAAATGGWIYPALGMLAFSSAFALPFFLLALFPGWLAKMPRAGSWLVSIKAFLGFLELAAALKFLSTVDLVWQLGYLTRPVFLALWFAIALMAALYLLQVVRLTKEEPTRIGPFRIGLGAAMIGVSVILLGAMNGARIGDFDAYLPPDDYGANAAPRETKWLKNDLAGAQKLAKEQNKPLLINFTGYACTNCRLMEKDVLPHGSVVKELDNYIAVELFTDGTDAKSREFNQFQQQKFGTVAIPLYAVVEPNGEVRGRLEGLERNPAIFAAFLNRNRETARVALAR